MHPKTTTQEESGSIHGNILNEYEENEHAGFQSALTFWLMQSEEQQEKPRAADLFAALQKDEPGIHQWWMNTFLPTLSGITDLGSSPSKNVKKENWTLYSLAVKLSLTRVAESRKSWCRSVKSRLSGVFTRFETDNEKNVWLRICSEIV
ncbi:hypothetical protein WG66_003577, partial [Moniliophthora roreri]